MKEIWVEIEGFRGYYVSNLGRIKSYRIFSTGIILKQHLNRKGYCMVGIYDNDNRKHYVQVHRIVLKTFNPVLDMDKLEVNHKDENKQNNCIENLEWCTHEENMNYGTARQRSVNNQRITHPNKKKVMCIETGCIYFSMMEAKRETGINNTLISRVCNEKIKTAGGYHWVFID